MATKPHLLIADDDINVLAGLNFLLQDEGYQVTTVTSVEAALAQVKKQAFSCALLDMNFAKDTTSGAEGIELITSLKELDEYLPIVMMTGWATIELAVSAMRLGANDFIQKPWDNERLLATLHTQVTLARSLRVNQRLLEHNQLLQRERAAHQSGLVAQSVAMKRVLSDLSELSKSDMNILLTGENGTGKSRLAQYVHQQSVRSGSPFVSVNMAAIPENLFESELFGHVKGAFTDAKDNRVGRFELAEGGTLFLDEVATIPLSQQAKLLRVLEERQFERVGSSQTLSADVRLLSATNLDLKQAVTDGHFRQDLYYRLNTIEIKVPSLRERPEDIESLAIYFLAGFSQKYHKAAPQLTHSAIQALCDYNWPGNIRELSHLMERVLFTSKGARIEASDLGLIHAEANHSLDNPNLTLDEIEQRILKKRFQYHQENATETAKSLGLSRSGYYRRLVKYGLDVK